MKIHPTVAGIVLLAAISGCSSDNQYSIVRMQMPGGYIATVVQNAGSTEACVASARRFLEPIKARCPDCSVQRSRCVSTLTGDERLLWTNDPIDQYSVVSAATRVLLTGPAAVTRLVCAQLARDISATGSPAKCFPPGQAR